MIHSKYIFISFQKKMGKTPDSNGGRVNYSNADKDIFMDIMKNADGGKLFKVVMSGTTTNDMKHRTWQRVSELFKNNTGLEVNTEQCRRLFTRMKAEEKQRHDYEINKSFMSQCSKTGGGPSPDVPPEIDGDQIDTASTLDFLDPTKTPWNSLTTAEQKRGHGDQDGDQEQIAHESFSGPSQASKKFKLPVQLPSAPPIFQLSSGGPRFRFPGSSEIRIPRPKFRSVNDSPSPTLSQETPSPSSLSTPERRYEKVELVNEDGTRQIIDIEEINGGETKGKSVKKTDKQVDIDPAKKYWTDMLAMQTINMQWRNKLLQEKIKTELLKQDLLKKKGKVKDGESDEESDVGEFVI